MNLNCTVSDGKILHPDHTQITLDDFSLELTARSKPNGTWNLTRVEFLKEWGVITPKTKKIRNFPLIYKLDWM